MISINDVSFSYRSADVFKSFSIKIERGEFVGILGQNGSGKSTLLKLMCNLLKPSSGGIVFNEKPLSEYRAKDLAKRIAFVPHVSTVPFNFTARQTVLMGRFPHLGRFSFEGSSDFDIVASAMKDTDSIRFADRPMHELSGGERQRVLLARAIAQRADVLMLDEPTNSLDIKHQSMICRLLRDLNSRHGHTVIVVLHDIYLAAAFCKRIVLLKEGEIKGDGIPADVITDSKIEEVFEISLPLS